MDENIDRIVELDIDFDNLEMDDMGVEVVSLVTEPAIEVDFLAFNQDTTALRPYVDNKGVKKFEEWIYSNIDKFKKPGGDLTAQGGTNHKEQMDKLVELGIPTEFPMGYCFQVAQFMFYALGGYDGPYTLKCIKKMQIPLEGIEFQTSHWYLQDEESGQIIDLTASQFEGITDINDWYEDGRRANLGFSWYKVNGKKVEFENTVPSLQTLKLYAHWKEEHGELEGIEKYYKACKYEELRKDFELQLAAECLDCVDEEFESYNDYPEAAKNNAQRAIDWAEENGWGSCGTDVGKRRAHQLAKGENISRETIARMASFARHEQNKDTPYSEGCGGLMWDAWGGSAGINWAKSKLRKIEEEMILEWAQEFGEPITEDYTVIKANQEFADISDIATAIQGLDILGKLGIKKDEPAETKYQYTGPTAERGFCKAMTRLNKLYSESDMNTLRSRLSSINPNMGPRGSNSYDVFAYKGGVNCRHFWSKNSLFKPEGSRRVLVVEEGPASGNAGKSNNASAPSPSGSVRNNARLNFSIDNEKRIVAGPLMIPNQMILRRNQNNEPYYVFFSKDTVKRIQERFNKEMNINNTDTQHDGNVHTENVLLEQWIVESNIHDKSKFYGFDRLPLGTWFGVYKINNDEDWERIKSGELRGFSVAGNFLEKAEPVNNQDDQTLSEIIKILRETK